MAKTLEERCASALSTNRITITDLEKLISDVDAERERVSALHRKASSDSIDFGLSESDRDAAASDAERLSRNALALANAANEFEQRLADKRESASRKVDEQACADALAERDALAARFDAVVPAAIESMIDLFQAIEANADRMRQAGLRERDAEGEARDMPINWYAKGEPIDRFVEMRIPRFDGHGRIWPVDRFAQEQVALDAAAHARFVHQAEEARPEVVAKREAEQEAVWKLHWKLYRIEPIPGRWPGHAIGPIRHHGGNALVVNQEPFERVMDAKMVAEAEALGLKVTPIEPADLPTSVGADTVIA